MAGLAFGAHKNACGPEENMNHLTNGDCGQVNLPYGAAIVYGPHLKGGPLLTVGDGDTALTMQQVDLAQAVMGLIFNLQLEGADWGAIHKAVTQFCDDL